MTIEESLFVWNNSCKYICIAKYKYIYSVYQDWFFHAIVKWSAQCEPASKSILIDGSIQELDCAQLVGRKFLRNRVEIELSQCICMPCAVYFVLLYLNVHNKGTNLDDFLAQCTIAFCDLVLCTLYNVLLVWWAMVASCTTVHCTIALLCSICSSAGH